MLESNLCRYWANYCPSQGPCFPLRCQIGTPESGPSLRRLCVCSVLTSEKLRIDGRGVRYNPLQFKFLRRKNAIPQFTLFHALTGSPSKGGSRRASEAASKGTFPKYRAQGCSARKDQIDLPAHYPRTCTNHSLFKIAQIKVKFVAVVIVKVKHSAPD